MSLSGSQIGTETGPVLGKIGQVPNEGHLVGLGGKKYGTQRGNIYQSGILVTVRLGRARGDMVSFMIYSIQLS